ncbi:MAG: sodium-dependent bicarbonate transport family permease [Flavobacteriales bacterium]
MNYTVLAENLTNPALLFFMLGILAVTMKSDLEIPSNSSRFIALYLLFAIGFKGGQELAHETFNTEIAWSLIFGLILSSAIPFYAYFILRWKLNAADAAATAAAYGSVSAVTFVTAISFLEFHKLHSNGHMVAVMALMESPAIISGLLLISLFKKDGTPHKMELGSVLKHALTNGSVVLILGSLIIGYIANEKQAEGIKPFTNELFKGFLAIFLLDMGISSGKKLKSFFSFGWFPIAFAMIFPLVNGSIVATLSPLFTPNLGDQFIFSVLAASASYIAVPAAMKVSAPQANPGLFLPMALAITFPVNITLGVPIYYFLLTS